MRAPINGTMSSPRDSAHAIAICAGLLPFSSAIVRNASTSARLCSRFALWKRGLAARKSRSRGCALFQPPPSRPRDSTPYAVTPMPSARHVGRIASSIPRDSSEYSICRSAIGATAAARRSVSAPTSDKPIWRT
ncbi:hypothetical protein WL27_15985 [Burkholderia multivorans]|nr:hypothetical protein WL27_15985 [Burkholderia multivorans]